MPNRSDTREHLNRQELQLQNIQRQFERLDLQLEVIEDQMRSAGWMPEPEAEAPQTEIEAADHVETEVASPATDVATAPAEQPHRPTKPR